ncbi:Y-family DNA polymerase [Rhodocyclus tenuis]|uniref:DNA polymerase V n=1 Tax=Rhodocyclus tenuis TaxID=1066 RepID=A0A840G352_RHOTE|nr:Y-family DNA polymerase [Rhodocyclus tenuis]MBB4248794.1 DNA polymerase V [Rhodocyclus tenuis]
MSFALVDCNNFYASCERVFNPKLAGKPVVVLSNNDGCVVARNAESKAMGIPMGVPWFKIEKEFRREGGIALSSNYALYADMSHRVMTLLAAFSPDQEIYSIDECFLGMAGFRELSSIGQDIREKVKRWTGLPVCVGFGATKTLAKLANHVAKKRPAWNGVCDLTALSAEAQACLIGDIEVDEVWGVGRRTAPRLAEMGITTVGQLRDADPTRIRQAFSVVLERTVRELRGESCLALEDAAPPKQQIMVSRSFGNSVHELADLQQAVAHFVGRAAEKLRSQGSCAGCLTVFIRTSPFRRDDPQYSQSLTLPLAVASDDTLELTTVATEGVRAIYRPGFPYAKAGVLLGELLGKDKVPRDLFADEHGSGRLAALMAAVDRVNGKFGRGTLKTGASTGSRGAWQMRQGRKSPCYSTRWEDLVRVRG